MQYLQQIKSPDDIKQLNLSELKVLAQEIREELIQVVSENGGHLAPNLGIVELTLALHNSSKNRQKAKVRRSILDLLY